MRNDEKGKRGKQNELSNCNFVKTVLMLLVILYHSILFWGGDWFTEDPAIVSPLLAGFAKYLNSFHIYAFTLVSGYIFYYIKYEKGQYQQFSAFIKTKAKRLLIPYVLIATVWVVPIQCLFFDYDLQTIVSKYVLATGPSQLWFLLMLFNVFVLFWLLSDFFQKHHLAGFFVVAGIFGCSILAGMVLPNIFMLLTSLRYLLFFWIGFKLRQIGTGILYKIPAVIWLAASILLFVLAQYLDRFELILILN